MDQCCSVKSRKSPFERCPRKTCGKSQFCATHSKQKKPLIFDSQLPNPLLSENDTDPITLEQIYHEVDGKKELCINGCHLFTYQIETNGKTYQRTLKLSSMRDLLQHSIRTDPFSNQPFPEEILQRARQEIEASSLPTNIRTEKEQLNIRLNQIIDKFQTVGYLIDIRMITKNRKAFYLSWLNEVNHLWIIFRRENPTIVPYVYNGLLPMLDPNIPTKQAIRHVTTILLDFMSSSVMAVMIVLSALAWISEEVRRAYPELTVM